MTARSCRNRVATETVLVRTLVKEVGIVLAVSEDDGVTQKATVGRSVAFKENKKIKPIVSLQPYRTFGDIEQPSSNFLFRLHQSHDGKSVQCMLTEADGGVWKQVAMQSIKDWFERQGLNVPIIA